MPDRETCLTVVNFSAPLANNRRTQLAVLHARAGPARAAWLCCISLRRRGPAECYHLLLPPGQGGDLGT